MSAVVCVRCGEPLADAARPCVWCREEREREAVAILISAAKSSSNASLLARTEAIETLRNLGYSSNQVVKARARALDGHSLEEILEVLAGEGERVEVAA